MKLAVVCNPMDNKLRGDTYSYVYRGMFNAILDRFNPSLITDDCSAQDIEADAILFWDVNSCHHIKIDGIENHKAIKIEYMSDPFQKEIKGVYRTYNMPVHKLGAKQRIERAISRGVEHIICPVRDGFYKFYSPIIGEDLAERMLMHFPPAPWFGPGNGSISERKNNVLANGATGQADGAYDFRTWAHKQPEVTVVNHWILEKSTPKGKDYGEFLKQWAAGLALCDIYPVVKYFEIPLAGCVAFMQHHPEIEDLGFKDHESCIFVNKDNFNERISEFLRDIGSHQSIAGAGRKLVAERYTAERFAEFVDAKIGELL